MQLITKIDETNTHGGAGYMMMAGYTARLSQWNRFDHKWKKGLRRAGLPYWHAHEHLGHPFGNKINTLINDHLLFGFVVRLDEKDFKEVYRAGAWGGKAQPDSMYGLCFRYCLSFVLERAQHETRRDDVVLNFVTEAGHVNEGARAQIVSTLKRKRISGVSEFFGYSVPDEKEKVPGLQAADALAYGALLMEPLDMPMAQAKPAYTIAEASEQVAMKCPVFRSHIDRAELATFKENYFAHIEYRRNHWHSTRKKGDT